MNIIYEKPTAEDYVNLRIRSGMEKKDMERSRIAIENSLFTASIYDDDKLIAFGRVVGDNGITYVISDVMVDENYRRKGYANRIMDVIDEYLDRNTFEDSYIFLIANSPADCIYSKHKFEYLSKDKCGMLRNQKKF